MKEGFFMLQIALVQMRVIPGFPDRNTETMLQYIAEARERNADLVIFPEMAIPGYLLGDTWEQPSFLEDCVACGEEIVAASRGITVMFGNVAVDWTKKNKTAASENTTRFSQRRTGV